MTVSKTLENPLIYGSSSANRNRGKYNGSKYAGAGQIAGKPSITFPKTTPTSNTQMMDVPQDKNYNQDPEECSFNLPPHIWSLPVSVDRVANGSETNYYTPAIVAYRNKEYFFQKERSYK